MYGHLITKAEQLSEYAATYNNVCVCATTSNRHELSDRLIGLTLIGQKLETQPLPDSIDILGLL